MRILILKLASMGDLIHLLPALTDAQTAYPNATFDWVIDKNFSQIASWHPAIDKKIITNHRYWRSNLTKKSTYLQISDMIQEIKKSSYDLVIDAQGNLKTALLSLFTSGKKVGWDASSIPEWGAHLFYDQKVKASKQDHAITRIRTLFAQALDYKEPTTFPSYNIDISQFTPPSCPLPSSYLVFVANASQESKLWPIASWKSLLQETIKLNIPILLPWGNEKERKQAEELSLCCNHAIVLPKLSLAEIGHVLLHAKAVVSMDTGLSHIAAALDIPTITLYGPTDPSLTGTVGKHQIHVYSSTHSLSSVKVSCVLDHLLELA